MISRARGWHLPVHMTFRDSWSQSIPDPFRDRHVQTTQLGECWGLGAVDFPTPVDPLLRAPTGIGSDAEGCCAGLCREVVPREVVLGILRVAAHLLFLDRVLTPAADVYFFYHRLL